MRRFGCLDDQAGDAHAIEGGGKVSQHARIGRQTPIDRRTIGAVRSGLHPALVVDVGRDLDAGIVQRRDERPHGVCRQIQPAHPESAGDIDDDGAVIDDGKAAIEAEPPGDRTSRGD